MLCICNHQGGLTLIEIRVDWMRPILEEYRSFEETSTSRGVEVIHALQHVDNLILYTLVLFLYMLCCEIKFTYYYH